MSKLLFDTNVLIDLVIATRPQYEVAKRLVETLADAGHTMLALTSNLKDVYYVCCRHYADEEQARRVVASLRRLFELVDLTAGMIDEALVSDEPDFEDGIVRVAAESSGCDVIVSRDVKAYRTSSCKRLSPAQAIAWVEDGAQGLC